MSVRESCYFATRTMRAVEMLAFGPASASDVAGHLRVDDRTARRLLRQLADEGYVVRMEEGRYRRYSLSMRIVALAGQVAERAALAELTVPFVARMCAETGKAAHLSIPSYTSVLCLVHDDGSGATVTAPQFGALAPAHCTAAGKALLAHRDRWRNSVLSAPLQQHTDHTITDPHRLRREMMQIRDRGFALEDRECRQDVCGVAAPVVNHTGEAIAALGLTVHASEVSRSQLLDLGAAVVEAASAASEALDRASGASLSHPAPRTADRLVAMSQASEEPLVEAAGASRG